MAHGRSLTTSTVALLVWAGMVGIMAQKPTRTTQKDRIIVTSILEKPYLSPKNDSGSLTGNDKYEGFVKDLLDELTRVAGHQYQLSLQTNFGALQPDGSWDGMVGELIKRNADMALAPLTETYMRARVVDFGRHFQTFSRVAIVKRTPKDTVTIKSISLDVRLGRLFAPLDDSVWLLSGLSWFVASLVLYLICRINPFEWRQMSKHREATIREGESFNCAKSYWFMLAAIFWQGFMRSPRSMGARIVVTFWWLYALIFVSMYIASLTNYLQSLPQSNQVIHHYSKIRSVRDISEDYNIKVGAIKGSATASYLEASQDEQFARLWNRLEKANTFEKTMEDGIRKVQKSRSKEPYVFFGESIMAEYFIRQPPCDLYVIRDFPFVGSYAPAYPIGSNLKPSMDLALHRLKEAGILNRLEQKWFHGECRGNYFDIPDEQAKIVKYPPFQRVDLASFSGALILLMIGLAAGALVTVVEIFIFRYFGKDYHESEQDKRPMKEKPEQSQKSGQPMTDV